MSFLKEEFKMKSILVSSVEGYSGKSVVIIALGRILRDVRDLAERSLERNAMELLGTLPYDPLLAGLYMILGKARIRGDAKIRGIKELVERVLDLGRLWGN